MKIKFLTMILSALALMACVGLQSGCAGPGTTPEEVAAHERQCRYFAGIYEAYLIAREDGNVSDAEVTAAKVAGVFLKLNCGYVPPPADATRTRGGPAGEDPAGEDPVDANGVPILKAP